MKNSSLSVTITSVVLEPKPNKPRTIPSEKGLKIPVESGMKILFFRTFHDDELIRGGEIITNVESECWYAETLYEMELPG